MSIRRRQSAPPGQSSKLFVLHNFDPPVDRGSLDFLQRFQPPGNGCLMKKVRKAEWWLFGVWAIVTVVIGGVQMSYHQPFAMPSGAVLNLAGQGDGTHWRAMHLLSGSCGCSQRVMTRIIARGPLPEVGEQVILVDGSEAYLPGTAALVLQLRARGFTVSHLSADDVADKVGLRGVPLLVFATPENLVAYVGGYGMSQDGGGEIYRNLREGQKPRPLPILGCALTTALRHTVDPLGLKY
jgi:hypothetical protein